jgi:hypothetical protein
LKYYPRISQVGLPLLAVRFADLAQDPAGTLADLCRVIGIPYFPRKEAFWEKDQHHLFGSLGVRRQKEWTPSALQARSFPEEFQGQLESLTRDIAGDAEVQEALASLRGADVSFAADGSGPSLPYTPHRVKPVWFYGQLAKRRARRYRPRRLDAAIEESAALPGERGPNPRGEAR